MCLPLCVPAARFILPAGPYTSKPTYNKHTDGRYIGFFARFGQTWCFLPDTKKFLSGRPELGWRESSYPRLGACLTQYNTTYRRPQRVPVSSPPLYCPQIWQKWGNLRCKIGEKLRVLSAHESVPKMPRTARKSTTWEDIYIYIG